MLVRWNPVRNLNPVAREFDEIFSDFFGDTTPATKRGGFMPSVDIRETDEGVMLKFDIPGIAKDDLEISIENNTLTVTGQRKEEELQEGERYTHLERYYGKFERSFHLTSDLDANKVEAKHENGVLTIEIPRSEEAKPRKIEVKAS